MEYLCNGHIPTLETDRLWLRKIEQGDADQLFEYWSDPLVVRYMNMPEFTDAEETLELIQLLNVLSNTEDTIRWGIELKSTGKLIGSCGFNTWQLAGAYRGEIGYELGRDFWGQGYMREALVAMFVFGYETMGLNRIEALLFPQNTSSMQLLTRLGFTHEGVLRDYQHSGEQFVDLQMYSLLRREFDVRY